jgi:hypothetical protein
MSTQARTTGSSLCAETKKALGLLEDTIKQIRTEGMSLDELSRHNAHQLAYEDAAKAYSQQIETQLKYFRDRWGFTYVDGEFGALYVPRPFAYCKTLLIIPKDIVGPEDIFGKWVAEKKFGTYKYTDKSLNDFVPNDKRRLGHYALLHSGRQEADDELKSRSWEQNQTDRIEAMRLTEVLLFEDVFFTEMKEHIDPDTATLTSSRDADGDVPCVSWNRDLGKLYVGYCIPQDANPDLRARAVSL